MDANDISRRSDQAYRAASEFLFREAQLLDDWRFRDWMELLSEEVMYRLVAPTVSMAGPLGDNSTSEVVLMDETMGSIKTRVQLLATPAHTIAENPRSFTRRFVTNITVDPAPDENLLQVRSYVLVYRSRASEATPHLFSISRSDSLRKVEGRFLLSRRFARLDQSIVEARNISTLF